MVKWWPRFWHTGKRQMALANWHLTNSNCNDVANTCSREIVSESEEPNFASLTIYRSLMNWHFPMELCNNWRQPNDEDDDEEWDCCCCCCRCCCCCYYSTKKNTKIQVPLLLLKQDNVSKLIKMCFVLNQ